MKENKFLKDSSILFALNILASVLNYLCQLFMARMLSVDSFGTVSTIFSFMMIIAVPGTTLTMITAKYFAGIGADVQTGKKRSYLNQQLKLVTALTIVVAGMLFMVQKPLGRLLSINNGIVLILAILLSAMGFYQPLYSGIFSGNKCFVMVGVYSLLIPLYKLVSVIVAYLFTGVDIFRLYVILVTMLFGTLITIIVGQWKTGKIIGKGKIENKVYIRRLFSKEDINALVLNVSLMFYMNVDLLSVRFYCGENESGLYGSVSLFGRIVYYFSTTLGTILLPSAASVKKSEEKKLAALNNALFLMIGFFCMCVFPINILKENIICLLYGISYVSAARYVKYISIISFSLSIWTILINFLVGLGRTKFATIAMLCVDGMILCTIFLLKNIEMILTGIGIVGMMGIIFIYLVGVKRKHML